MSKKDFRRHGSDRNRNEQHNGVADTNAAGSLTAADFAEEFEQLTAPLRNGSSEARNSEEPDADDFEEYENPAFSLSGILRNTGKICAFPFHIVWSGVKFAVSTTCSCFGSIPGLLKKISSFFVLKGNFNEESKANDAVNKTVNNSAPAVKSGNKPKTDAKQAEFDEDEYSAPQWSGYVFKGIALLAVLLLCVSGYFGFNTFMKNTPSAESQVSDAADGNTSPDNVSSEDTTVKKMPEEKATAHSPFAAPAPPPPVVQQKQNTGKDIGKEAGNEKITAAKEPPKPELKETPDKTAVKSAEKPADKSAEKTEKDVAKQEPKKEIKSAPAPVNPAFGSTLQDKTASNTPALENNPWAAPAPPASSSKPNSEPPSAESPWALPPIPALAETKPAKTDTAKTDAKLNTFADKEIKNEAVKETFADKTPPKPAANPAVKPEQKPEVAAVSAKPSSNEKVRPLAMLPLENERLDNPLAKQIPSAAASAAGKIASSPLQPLSSEEIAPNIVSKKESALDIPASETVRPLVQTPAIQNSPPRAPLDNKNDAKTANPFFGDTIKPLAPPKEMRPDKPLLIPDSEKNPLIVSQPAIKTTPAMSAAMAEPALEIPKDAASSSASVFQQKIPEKTVDRQSVERQSAAVFAAQPKQQNPLPAVPLTDKVPAADFADRTGEPSLGSSLQRQLKELRSPSDAEPALSFQNKNTASNNLPLLNMPQNPDSATENPLLKLVPTGVPAENAAEIKRTLPPETSVPKPLLAEVNTGYRRSMDSARPAPLQVAGTIANGTNAASNTAGIPNEERAKLFLDKIDEQIKRSPAATERYTVQPGDTYMTISDMKFGTSLFYRALAAHNRRLGIDYMPASGTVIEIPTAEFLKTNYADVLSRGNYRQEAQNNGGFRRVSSASQRTGGQPLASSSANPSAQHYTVQHNDNVFKIAMNQLGDTSRWREILALNSDTIGDPRNLQPGTKIVLPNQSGSINTAARSRGVY